MMGWGAKHHSIAFIYMAKSALAPHSIILFYMDSRKFMVFIFHGSGMVLLTSGNWYRGCGWHCNGVI